MRRENIHAMTAEMSDAQLRHERRAHIHGNTGKHDEHCEACALGKAKRRPHADKAGFNEFRNAAPGEIFSFDLKTVSTISLQGSSYYIIFYDAVSRVMYAAGLVDRSHLEEAVFAFIRHAEKFRVPLRHLHADNEGLTPLLDSVLSAHHVRQTVTGAYGKAAANPYGELAIQITWNTVRTLLISANLGEEFWEYALNYAVHTHNRVPRKDQTKAPLDILLNKTHTTEHFVRFGCLAYVLIDPETRAAKSQTNIATRAIFTGYSEISHCLLFVIPDQGNKAIRTRNYKLQEKMNYEASTSTKTIKLRMSDTDIQHNEAVVHGNITPEDFDVDRTPSHYLKRDVADAFMHNKRRKLYTGNVIGFDRTTKRFKVRWYLDGTHSEYTQAELLEILLPVHIDGEDPNAIEREKIFTRTQRATDTAQRKRQESTDSTSTRSTRRRRSIKTVTFSMPPTVIPAYNDIDAGARTDIHTRSPPLSRTSSTSPPAFACTLAKEPLAPDKMQDTLKAEGMAIEISGIPQRNAKFEFMASESDDAQCKEASHADDTAWIYALLSSQQSHIYLMNNHEPATLEEALHADHPDRQKWLDAFRREVSGLFKRRTCVVVNRSEANEYLKQGKRFLRFKVVLKIKTNDEGIPSIYKCRFVAQGFLAVSGMYDEVYAPTLALESLRLLVQVSMQRGWHLYGFDVEQAFLYSPLKEVIYADVQPTLRKALKLVGYDIGDENIIRLDGSLYGIYQGAHDWIELFAKILVDIGFKRGRREPCIFWRDDNIILSVYVDDGTVACKKESQYVGLLQELRQNRIQNLVLKELGSLKKVIGIQVEQDLFTEGGIRYCALHQRQYIENVVKAHMGDLQWSTREKWKVTRPYRADLPEHKIENLREADAKRYRSTTGALLYLMLCTRVDIALAMGNLCRHSGAPTTNDMAKLETVLMYVYTTQELALKYEESRNEQIECIVDANFASDKRSRKSATGALCYYGGGLMSWLHKIQGPRAQNTMEAELYALGTGATTALGLSHKLRDIKISAEDTYVLSSDSQAALQRCMNPIHISKSKHIATKELFVCDEYADRKLTLQKIDTFDNVADALTKELPVAAFTRHVDFMFAGESERKIKYPERMWVRTKKEDIIESRPDVDPALQPQNRSENEMRYDE